MNRLLPLLFLLNISSAGANESVSELESDERELDRFFLFHPDSSPKDKWNDFNPQNYVFVVKNGGNDNELNLFPLVQIFVLDGKIHKVVNLHPTMNTHMTPKPENFKTIPELFNFIDEQYKKSPMKVEVMHHWGYAYPTKIEIDRTAVPHDEVFIEIIEFDLIRKSNQSKQ